MRFGAILLDLGQVPSGLEAFIELHGPGTTER